MIILVTGSNKVGQFYFNLLFLNLWPLTLKRCIGIFSKIRNFVTQQVLIQLYYSLIYPFLAYSLLINRGNTYQTTLRPLIILQKQAVRIIIFSDYKSHSCPLLHEQRLLKLRDLIYLDNTFFYVRLTQTVSLVNILLNHQKKYTNMKPDRPLTSLIIYS